MRPRPRTLAALFALWALSLSMTGGAWAAMCGAGVPGGATPTAAVQGRGDHRGHHGPAPVPAPAGSREHREGADRGAPACPLMAPGGAGSCLGTFVGPGLSARVVSTGGETHDFLPPGGTRGLLDPSPPFRPPEG
jgi:hypothetical protein